MIEFVLDIIASLAGPAFEEWYQGQRWWVKAVAIGSFVFVIAMICYFVLIVPILFSSRGS